MAKIISTIKAILTRIIFSAHSIIAVWQVTLKKGIFYWTLCGPLGLLLFEGLFTLAIKKNQEWRWFCPSVFLYLGSVVPAIWLLELDKVETRNAFKTANQTADAANALDNLGVFLKGSINIPRINLDTYTTLIEQFLMLILIVGRWLLPKGDLTRDQLSQLLLVYIGTAADIIEFFDSYKDASISSVPLLVYLTLGIWSWSLLQFTIVLSATRARRSRGSGTQQNDESTDCCNNCCCGIDVWGIVLNVILQDAPFLTFRLLIIFQYNIINYMNVFFTCKNSLVIILQMYRLYVVNSEFWKARRELKRAKLMKHYKANKRRNDQQVEDIFTISSERVTNEHKRKSKKPKGYSDDEYVRNKHKPKKDKNKKRSRKDTGYSTASSQNLYSTKLKDEKCIQKKSNKKVKRLKDISSSQSDSEVVMKKQKRHKEKANTNKRKSKKNFDAVVEESSSTSSQSSRYEVINEKSSKKRIRCSSTSSSSSSSSSSFDKHNSSTTSS